MIKNRVNVVLTISTKDTKMTKNYITVEQLLELIAGSTERVSVASDELLFIDPKKLMKNVCVMFMVNPDGSVSRELILNKLITEVFEPVEGLLVNENTTLEAYILAEGKEDGEELDEEDFTIAFETFEEQIGELFDVDLEDAFESDTTIGSVANTIIATYVDDGENADDTDDDTDEDEDEDENESDEDDEELDT